MILAHVRFKWKRMDEWKIESDVTGGVLYDQPVRMKMESEFRKVLVTANLI